jgi:hypothetical protein
VKNENRQKMSEKAKKAFLMKFASEAFRGLRGGVTEAELASAINEASILEVQDS